MAPSHRAASEGSTPRGRSRSDHGGHRNPTATGSQRQYQKRRVQRAMWACERCRVKKLRCSGGHPCSACRRAEIECDFGDRGLDPQQSISNTNQRLSQLEKTVTDLVSGLSHLTRPRQPGHLPSPSLHTGQAFSGTSVNLADPHHHVPVPERAINVPHVENPSYIVARAIAPPAPSFAAQFDVAPPPQSQGTSVTPERMCTSPIHSGEPDGLGFRWAALQNNAAPFPPLMAYPTLWSGEPTKTSPEGDPPAHFGLGMTHYEAKVTLQSEPVSERMVSESVARALFSLFFQKCHPLFPLLEPYKDLSRDFDHIRSSSPFLFTTILAIAGRYYTGYRETQSSKSGLPLITASALTALADLACAHLGFAIFRKQHQLSDVQATLLLSVWIPRGKGQSADQWMVTGLCTRLAYRIGVPDSIGREVVMRLLNSTHFDANDIREANSILPQWHTWLIINQYDTWLSLGFGRPHPMPFAHACPQDYLTIIRKLGPSAQIDSIAAAYVTSLAELSAIAADLIPGLRAARLPPTPRQNKRRPAATAWSEISALLSDLNPRLDEWQRKWTWGGSYNTVLLGKYTNLVKIYSEHTRLCLNSLSLNFIAANATANPENPVATSFLARACEAAVSLVQYYVESSDAEPIVRYAGDYLVLILGQAAMFFVRVLVARLEQPLPIDRLVLAHHLKAAIELLQSNDMSTTGICGWVAQLSRDLARYAGLDFDRSEGNPTDSNFTMLDSALPGIEWDFDICALLGHDIPTGGTGLDLGHCFDFAQTFFPPPSILRVHDEANSGQYSPTW
ncbi:hypothetical protein IFM46972_10769 [Aspergillus udagawae]|uniref:Transcriptional activator of proteases prtT n=1 Tax=Aspergillus udagawae TaxID=91492 RepID=A0A8H3SED4_9EURO|nr:hypothetical protein IFM46972_10769 [Aspergillus udagawae]